MFATLLLVLLSLVLYVSTFELAYYFLSVSILVISLIANFVNIIKGVIK